MWSKRIRYLLTISCSSLLLFVSPTNGQGYGGVDDSQNFGGNQFGGGGQGGFPQNQQISSLPQYESAEQAPRQNPGFPPQQNYNPQGNGGGGGGPPPPPGQYGGGPPSQQQQPQGGGQGPPPQNNMWWQGQNAFQRPPGHPGVEQLAPPSQRPNFPGATTPAYGAYGNGAPQQQTTTYRPPPPAPTQAAYNPPPPPPPGPQIPQEPNVQPFPNQPPFPQQNPTPAPYGQPPTPPPPQNPPQAGFGWNPPPPSQQPPQQNYNPQGTGSYGQPPVIDEAPDCQLVNKADCHKNNNNDNRRNFNNIPAPPPQNYQPPPQFQPTQPPYQPQPQQNQPPPPPPPNQGYQPPPPQQQPYTPAPYTPPQVPPRQNPPYQSNTLSSPNFQRPPQQPRPQPQQQPRPQQPQEPSVPYPGCPAAMKCVQDEYCNAIGLIEDAPIQFSAADRLHRVALMECSEPMTGIVGVCCRDPNYTDPWPDMKKDNGQHHPHHPDKGQAQGQPSFQPPQGNHLQAGSGNPYSGIKVNNDDDTGSSSDNNNKINKKLPKSLRIISPFVVQLSSSSSPNLTSESSKQTLQVLEPCSPDELCLSMSQCHSLNPQFMAKTGLNPVTAKHFNNFVATSSNKQLNDDDEEPLKIKRCKYERSGIHYLCCKKPTSEITSLTSVAPTTTTSQFTPFRFTPTTRIRSTSSTFPSTSTSTTMSSLITGVGLRFHSGLHSPKQKELNDKKPNPYRENEAPIQLISPAIPEKFTNNDGAVPFGPFAFFDSFGSTRPFRFTTTTTTTPSPSLTTNPRSSTFGPFSTRDSQKSLPVFAKVVSTSRTYFSTTALPSFSSSTATARPLTVTTLESSSSTSTGGFTSTSDFTNTEVFTATTPTPTTTSSTTEGKVDISKIPVPVPLRPELKAEPPIGFIFKGDDLFIPEVEIPSQNYLVPINEFKVVTEPPPPPPPEEDDETTATTQDFGVTVTTDDGGDNNGGEVQDNHHEQEQLKLRHNSTKIRDIFKRRNPFLHNNSIEGTTIYSILEEGTSGSQETTAG